MYQQHHGSGGNSPSRKQQQQQQQQQRNVPPPPINTTQTPTPRLSAASGSGVGSGGRGSSGRSGGGGSSGLTPIMRQGRFLSSPGAAAGAATGSSVMMTPGGGGMPHQYSGGGGGGGGYHSQQQQQQQQQYYARGGGGGTLHNPISPTSQVRFEEEEEEAMHDYGHSPSFLFEEGEWSESGDDNDDDHDGGGGSPNNRGSTAQQLPSEAQLTLLCLDYLRDLRRSYLHPQDLLNAEGLHADYIALAAWSLSRAFVRPRKLQHGKAKVSSVFETVSKSRGIVDTTSMFGGGGLGVLVEDDVVGNDAWYRTLDDDLDVSDDSGNMDTTRNEFVLEHSNIRLPTTMEEITNEILLRHPNETDFLKRDQQNDDDDENSNDDDDDDDQPFYEHNDNHYSNSHRFYLLNGLASDASSSIVEGLVTSPRNSSSINTLMTSGGPLSFGEIVTAGLGGLRARSRIEADYEMVHSNPLFRQFVQAASDGGFFQEKNKKKGEDRSNAAAAALSPQEEERRSRLLYEEKYRKVVNKFRSKLASKEAQFLQPNTPHQQQQQQHMFGSSPSRLSNASPSHRINSAYRIMSGNLSVSSSTGGGGDTGMNHNNNSLAIMNNDVAERQRRRRERRMERVKSDRGGGAVEVGRVIGLPRMMDNMMSQDAPESKEGAQKQTVSSPSKQQQQQSRIVVPSSSPTTPSTNDPPTAHQQAEQYNTLGNSQMQSKSFQKALETYTSAIQLSASNNNNNNNNNSHVYYSNRSAAHLSLNNYQSSISDSYKSIELNPNYAKAHSRLGLAYFASGRYDEAVNAYEAALVIDPGNEWSRNHLEKARKEQQEEQQQRRQLAGGGGSVDDGEMKEGGSGSGSGSGSRGVENIYVVNDGGGGPSPMKTKKGMDPEPSPSSMEDGSSNNWPSPFDDGDNSAKVAGEDSTTANAVAKENEGEKDSNVNNDNNDTNDEDEKTRQANNHKDSGNQHMSNKEYEKALQKYNLAISTSPTGPNSHVYYSNRAAAYCYLAEYDAAAADCQTSIELNPTYEKAHARLGLSLFFKGDYQGAMEAYTKSLELDPSNNASRSYLKKAKSKLDEQQQQLDEQQRIEEENNAKLLEEQCQRESSEGNNEEREQKKREKEENTRRRNDWLERQELARVQQRQQQQQQEPEEEQQQQEGQEEEPLEQSHEVSITDEGVQVNAYYEYDDVEEEEEEGEERSLGDNTGITSTGLTSIVTNDNEDEIEIAESPRRAMAPGRMSSLEQQQQQGVQEAFDPFATDDEC